MPKPKIEPGDWITLQVPVTSVWDEDNRVTVSVNGQLVTMNQDNESILDVTKAERERPSTGRVGTSKLGKLMSD